MLNAFEATPEDVRLAVTQVLAEATFRQNAKRLQAEIAALPGPEAGVILLEGLVK